MEHVTSDLKLIDRLWNDPTYGLDGFSTEGGYIRPHRPRPSGRWERSRQLRRIRPQP